MEVDGLVGATRGRATPFLAVDATVLDHNLTSMQAACEERGVALRPHVKTHKSTVLARRQLELGAVGLTCATLSEALGLGRAGLRTSVFVAAPVWFDEPKTALLAEVCRAHDDVLIACDSEELIVAVAAARPAGFEGLGVMIEIDSGLDRTGVPADHAGALGRRVVGEGLRLAGAFTHGGHGYEPGRSAEAADDEVRVLEAAERSLRDAGVGTTGLVLSAGSTPTARRSARPPVTEERPGTYVFNDAQQVATGETDPVSVAVAVVATVIHVSAGKAVIDAGAKIFTKDRAAWLPSYGAVPALPTATVERLYDNHGVIRLDPHGSAPGSPPPPRVGDRLLIVPNHICPVVNQLDAIVMVGADGSSTELVVDLREHLS